MEAICSANLKTGWSINFPIQKTCSPTSVCRELCYARKGRLSLDQSLNRQERVFKLFNEYSPKILAEKIADEYRKKKMTFLRWCGSGDLFTKAVKVLNLVAEEYPESIHWVVTRKPSAAIKVKPLDNIYLMFSLDNSKDSIKRKAKVDNYLLSQIYNRVYYSYLRQYKHEDTLGASIIFNQQQKKGQLPYDDKKRVCPVDADVVPIKNACESCRKCFSPRVYNA